MAVTETDIYKKDLLIFGCGNILLGNDGFGPEVANHLNSHFAIPGEVLVLDAGTGIRDYIFDLLLMENKPKQVIIIDAVTLEGKQQGEIFEISIPDIPKEKMSDFSLHQSPCSNLLSQLKEQGVNVRVLGMQTESIPNTINPGLCPKAQQAVLTASSWIQNEIQKHLRLTRKTITA
ncbi:MAG: hydrogenase maturation protease [Pseudomonadota bacterium]